MKAAEGGDKDDHPLGLHMYTRLRTQPTHTPEPTAQPTRVSLIADRRTSQQP